MSSDFARMAAAFTSEKREAVSVQRQPNSRGWLHRACPRKRHQMRHLCDLRCLLAKQGALPAELPAHI
jgi:hypothetical protein